MSCRMFSSPWPTVSLSSDKKHCPPPPPQPREGQVKLPQAKNHFSHGGLAMMSRATLQGRPSPLPPSSTGLAVIYSTLPAFTTPLPDPAKLPLSAVLFPTLHCWLLPLGLSSEATKLRGFPADTTHPKSWSQYFFFILPHALTKLLN